MSFNHITHLALRTNKTERSTHLIFVLEIQILKLCLLARAD